MGDKVVHAQGGQRAQYLPLKSQLTSSVYPNAVIKQLLAWFPFPIMYIADLDAIETGQFDKAFYQQLQVLFPKLTIWLDAGIRNLNDWLVWSDHPNIKPIVGSESLDDIALLEELQQTEFILSLDFRNGELLGKYNLLEQSHLWPDTIIVMSLDNVGSDAGTNQQLFNKLKLLKPKARWISAGGVRGEEDLKELMEKGTSGALIASALHKGRISVETIHQILS